MKIVIFAGGSGRRLWPISRKKSPKQFEPIIGEKSTLRLAVDRVLDQYGAVNIFISTNEAYVDIIRQQLPELPPANVIGEPTRRDLAAAVGLALAHLAHATPDEALNEEPVAILWGDNYMDQVDVFQRVLDGAEKLIAGHKAKILFIGETPRFANDQLGWIGLGEELGSVNGRPFALSAAAGPVSTDVCRKYACVEYWLLRYHNRICAQTVPTASTQHVGWSHRNRRGNRAAGLPGDFAPRLSQF